MFIVVWQIYIIQHVITNDIAKNERIENTSDTRWNGERLYIFNFSYKKYFCIMILT